MIVGDAMRAVTGAMIRVDARYGVLAADRHPARKTTRTTQEAAAEPARPPPGGSQPCRPSAPSLPPDLHAIASANKCQNPIFGLPARRHLSPRARLFAPGGLVAWP